MTNEAAIPEETLMPTSRGGGKRFGFGGVTVGRKVEASGWCVQLWNSALDGTSELLAQVEKFRFEMCREQLLT